MLSSYANHLISIFQFIIETFLMKKLLFVLLLNGKDYHKGLIKKNMTTCTNSGLITSVKTDS